MTDFLNSDEKEILSKVAAIAQQKNLELYVVGGIIRDYLCKIPQKLSDIDLVVKGDARILSQSVAATFQSEDKYFPDFLTAKVTNLPYLGTLDFASCRKESYPTPGALPLVAPTSNIEDDAKRRDFTINALYIKISDFVSEPNLKEKILDQVGGLKDLEAKVLRVFHPKSFIDDPTRLFRAIRYKTKVSARLEGQTQNYFDDALEAKVFQSISKQRVLSEVYKAIDENCWIEVLKGFAENKLLAAADILDAQMTEMFVKALSCNLDRLAREERPDFFNFLLYFFSASSSREERFRNLGFGKKFFNKAKNISNNSDSAATNLENVVKDCFRLIGYNQNEL